VTIIALAFLGLSTIFIFFQIQCIKRT
jgi:hypothetical protein